jgi:hypothetical protein
MIYDILFAAAISLWVYLRLVDHNLTRKFIYYGLEEGNRLLRDKYGQLVSGPRAFLFDFIVAAAFIAIYVWLTREWAWTAPAAGSVVSFLIIQKNRKSMKSQRRRQLNILNSLSANPPPDGTMLSLSITSRVDRHWFTLFPWIYEPAAGPLNDTAEINRAAILLSGRLVALARSDRNSWFPA